MKRALSRLREREKKRNYLPRVRVRIPLRRPLLHESLRPFAEVGVAPLGLDQGQVRAEKCADMRACGIPPHLFRARGYIRSFFFRELCGLWQVVQAATFFG